MSAFSTNRINRLVWILGLLSLGSCATKDTIVTRVQSPIPDIPCSVSLLEGYTDRISYYPGDKVSVFLQAKESVSLCRLDMYDVNGKVVFNAALPLFPQAINGANPAETGYGYLPTAEMTIPQTLPSGIYLIENKIPFIVKTRKTVDLTVVYPINTANAYSQSGGKNLYSVNRPPKVSFLRPIYLQPLSEYCLKWFSTLEGVTIGYISDQDLDFYSSIEKSKMVVIPGHSEYWTRVARSHFDRFIDSGGHALVLSGNTMWWQVRYSDDRHEMICYKNEDRDPEINPLLKTINWNANSLQYSILESIGADFQHGGYGLQKDNGWNGFKITTPDSPLLLGSNLGKGDILSLPSGEYDGTPVRFFYPDGFPEIVRNELNFEKIELIGFDKGSRGGLETVGTFIVFQKTKSSGIVINAATYNWCSDKGIGGPSGDLIKSITHRAITLLLANESVFSK